MSIVGNEAGVAVGRTTAVGVLSRVASGSVVASGAVSTTGTVGGICAVTGLSPAVVGVSSITIGVCCGAVEQEERRVSPAHNSARIASFLERMTPIMLSEANTLTYLGIIDDTSGHWTICMAK
jgi:hypothetical protein